MIMVTIVSERSRKCGLLKIVSDLEGLLKRAKLCRTKIPGFYESKDHVDQLTGRAVPPVIALQRNQHLTKINSETGCLKR